MEDKKRQPGFSVTDPGLKGKNYRYVQDVARPRSCILYRMFYIISPPSSLPFKFIC